MIFYGLGRFERKIRIKDIIIVTKENAAIDRIQSRIEESLPPKQNSI